MKRFWAAYAVFVILLSCALYINHSLYKTAVADSDGKIFLPFDNSLLGITISRDNDINGKITAFSRRKVFKHYYYDRKGKLLFCGYKVFFGNSRDFYTDGRKIFDIRGKVYAKADMVSLGREYFLLGNRRKDFYKTENDFVFNANKLDYNLFDTKKGKIVFPGHIPGIAYIPFLGMFESLNNDFYTVENKGKYGLCDSQGNIIIPIEQDFKIVSMFEDNYIYKDESNRYNLCDRSGKNIFKNSFEHFFILGDKLYLNQNKKDCYVYNKGKRIKSDVMIVSLCKNAYIFQKEYYIICKNGKYGIWDKKGKEIIKPKYEHIDKFAEDVGFIACKSKFKDEYSNERNLYGVVNEKGEEIIPFNNIDIEAARNGMIKVLKYCGTGLQQYKEYDGMPGFDMPYGMQEDDRVNVTEPKYVMKKRNITVSKWGLFDNKGQMIVPCEYDNIDIIKDYYLLRKGNKSYFCHKNGKVIKEGNMNPSYQNNMIFYNTGSVSHKYYNYKEDRIYNSLEEFIVSKNPQLKGKNIKVFSNLDHYIIVMGGRK